MLISIIIFLIAFSLLAWRRLDWALLLLIAALPAYLIRFSVAGLPSTLLEAMVLISGAIWLIKYFWPENKNFLKESWKSLWDGKLNLKNFSRPQGRMPYPYGREMILILIISLTAAGISSFSPGALGIWKAYFFEAILLFIIILNVFKKSGDVIKIFTALAVSALIVSLIAVWQKLSGQMIANPFWAALETRRVVSVFGYPNAVGLYLAPIILILSGWFASLSHKFSKIGIALGITILLSVLAIYFARSDGALTALIIGTGLTAMLSGKKARLTTLLIIIIGAGTIFYLYPTGGTLIKKISFQDLSGEIRKQQWRESWDMLLDQRLLSGAGLNNYQTAVAPYHQEGIFFNFDDRPNFDAVVWASSTLQAIYWQPVEIYLYPHNIFLNFWSELSLFGALLFMWIIGKFLFITSRLAYALNKEGRPEKYWALGLFGAMMTIFIHGLVDVPYFKNDLALMFWIIIAMGAVLKINYDHELKDLKKIT